jgi:signal transduction histidine kinase
VAFLAGGGELGARMRAFDWARTPLGSPERWPQSLKTAVRIMLTSRQPIWIGWGPGLTYLYNDAYRSIVGGKHPDALGRPLAEVWREIWDDIAPMLATAMNGDEGTYVEAELLIMERHGYPEETYYTFSYSPIPEDPTAGSQAGGIICANTEDTPRVIGERQIALLRELAARTAEARTWQEACERSARAMATDARDIVFSMIYMCDRDCDRDDRMRLAAHTFVEPGHPAAPAVLDVDDPRWPNAEVMRTQQPRLVSGLDAAHGDLPAGDWSRPPSQAAVLPITPSGDSGRRGVVIVGLNPYRVYDDGYQGFLGLVAGQIAAAIGNAQAYEEERRRAESLAELDRAKTAFFSNVSHEFRTPLALMLGPIEELLARPAGAVPPEDRRELRLLHRNGLRLQKLVNTLLDFSRIEAGRVEARYQPTDLAALTAELASNFRSACERAGLRLVVECPPLPGSVFVDREMWEKIVLNLVSNAFKFTLEGEISVAVGAAGDHAELVVRDTGAGIPAGEMPRLFDRFHQVEGTRGRSREGSGIGLALVQELVRLHGGAIHVDSEPERGTAFTVRVPFGTAHLPIDRVITTGAEAHVSAGAVPYVEEALRWVPDLEPDGSGGWIAQGVGEGGPRVLLADDNADMRGYVSRLLADQHRVTAVTDGLAALEAARRDPPDLILTDVMMPGLDGFGLLRELRADPRTKELPIILLSARAGEEARVEGLEAGADDYLIKPFSSRELVAKVSTQLALARMRRQAAETLREVDRRKDEFLATLAHELRNPLAPIRTGIEMLDAVKHDPAAVERVRGVLERQTRQLITIVDDLLDVSRITRGKLELRRCRVRLADVVQSAVEAARPLIDHAGHDLTLSLPPGEVSLHADPHRLAQVLSNLLNNAAKYTPDGGQLILSAVNEGDQVAITVTDTGVGIPADRLDGIFEMFAQIDRPLERGYSGLGIGLTLVRWLVELHGGRVAVHSDGPDRGSTFTVWMPVLEAEAGDESPAPAARRPAARRRVLVVDDNRDGADMLSAIVELLGNEVRTAADGVEAVEAAAEFLPDVVLMDLGMPRMNGYEAARHIRAQDWGRDMTLIALTGWGQEADKQRTREAGFDHHLVKPADPAQLEALLDGRGDPGAWTPRRSRGS